jgi:1,4-dihydroxy-6-naphthoate synthase
MKVKADTFEITIAHSPDPDDAFMFWALSHGRIETGGIRVRHELADIQTLNERALAGRHEVTAVSIHAFAYLADRYALAPSGASIGDGYGPILVAREPLDAARLDGVTVAVPGELTTAFLVLKLMAPSIRHRVLPFDRIMDSVAAGDVPAGLLIHEGQLTHAGRGLVPVIDLGVWWKERTGLPLPLGGNAIRRDLGGARMARVADLLLRSIDFALAHREEALAHAMAYGRGIDRALADRFVSMYVNEYTRDYGEAGRQAVELLLAEAHGAGIVPRRVVASFVES